MGTVDHTNSNQNVNSHTSTKGVDSYLKNKKAVGVKPEELAKAQLQAEAETDKEEELNKKQKGFGKKIPPLKTKECLDLDQSPAE